MVALRSRFSRQSRAWQVRSRVLRECCGNPLLRARRSQGPSAVSLQFMSSRSPARLADGPMV